MNTEYLLRGRIWLTLSWGYPDQIMYLATLPDHQGPSHTSMQCYICRGQRMDRCTIQGLRHGDTKWKVHEVHRALCMHGTFVHAARLYSASQSTVFGRQCPRLGAIGWQRARLGAVGQQSARVGAFRRQRARFSIQTSFPFDVCYIPLRVGGWHG